MSFSPRSTAEHEASLSVAVAPSSNGRHLIHFTKPNAPYFHLGDTAWELLHRLSSDEAELFLRNRAAKGFTGIMVTLLAEHGGLDFPNRNGDWPFFPAETSSAESYTPDLMRPNPAYFAVLDTLIPLAASLGITIWLTPTWGRYVNGGYYGSPLLWTPESAHSFGKFLGERYPFHPFVLGGDSNRYWNENALAHIKEGKDPKDLEVKDYGPISEAMAKGIVEGEADAKSGLSSVEGAKDYKSFITFHSAQVWLPTASESSSSAQFPNADWLSLDVIQTGHHDSAVPPSDVEAGEDDEEEHAQTGAGGLDMWFARSSYVPIRRMYSTPRPDGRPRPVMDLEPHYENTHHFFNSKAPIWTSRDIRSGAWQAIFAGSCGYTYGCNSIWQFHNATSKSHPPIAPPTTAFTDWHLELDLEGAFQVSAIRKIMESLPDYFERVPDQSLILSSTNEPMGGSPAGDKLISAMRSTSWLAVHLPHGGEVEVRLDEKVLPDKWRAWWMNPKSGSKEVFERGSGSHSLKARSSTEGSIDQDWILYVDRDAVA